MVSCLFHFKVFFSRTCINTTDLFEAYQRSFLIERKGLRTFALLIMFYSDLTPKKRQRLFGILWTFTFIFKEKFLFNYRGWERNLF